MSKRKPAAKTAEKLVRIVPIPGVAIPPEHFDPPIRSVTQVVTEAVWKRINAFRPRAFRRVPLNAPKGTSKSESASSSSPAPAQEAPAGSTEG